MSKLRYAFNLPGNAAKYTHEGVIGPVTQGEQEDDADWIRLSLAAVVVIPEHED